MTIEPLEMTIQSELFSEVDHMRSPGLHLSRIIADLNEVRGGTKYPETDPATRQNYFATGFLWERALKVLFVETRLKSEQGVLVRPGEFTIDGIAMSPDALDLDDYVVEEYKATYMSSARPIEDPCFWPWTIQMKCYCRAVGTRVARLRTWFVAGDWKGSGPQVRAWTFHFTDRDVEEAFTMCKNHAKAKGWL